MIYCCVAAELYEVFQKGFVFNNKMEKFTPVFCPTKKGAWCDKQFNSARGTVMLVVVRIGRNIAR
jgi:hypothetical protein